MQNSASVSFVVGIQGIAGKLFTIHLHETKKQHQTADSRHLTSSHLRSSSATTAQQQPAAMRHQAGETKKSPQTGERQHSRAGNAGLCEPMHLNTQHFRSIKQFIEQSEMVNIFCLG